jgi:hypothetical protein
MTTRCKFRIDSINHSVQQSSEIVQGEYVTTQKDYFTLVASPVYHNRDPEHENTKFWNYTPSGKLELSTINKAAIEWAKPGMEIYIDISPAPSP